MKVGKAVLFKCSIGKQGQFMITPFKVKFYYQNGRKVKGVNLTEKGRKEEKDKQNSLERQLERIFSSLGHGMYVVDKEKNILLWNRSAESILTWTEDDVLGKSCKELIADQDDEGNQLCDEACPLDASMEDSRTVFAGTVWAHSKGEDLVPVHVSCAPLFDDEGDLIGALVVFADVTREKEIDRMKSEVWSIVAHEFRSPLTSIKGYLELVLNGEAGEINEEQRKFLKTVESNVESLEQLVNDFLGFEKIDSGRIKMHWEELDTKSLIEETVKKFAPLAKEKSLQMVVDLDEAAPILGDRQLFQQMLNNLVSNAIKFTNDGEVGVRLYLEGERDVIEVWDTGVGIPKDELGKVGEKFFRASTAKDAVVEGSGLGLAISREIIRKHGGQMLIESVPGEGSRFIVSMPLMNERTIIQSPEESTDE